MLCLRPSRRPHWVLQTPCGHVSHLHGVQSPPSRAVLFRPLVQDSWLKCLLKAGEDPAAGLEVSTAHRRGRGEQGHLPGAVLLPGNAKAWPTWWWLVLTHQVLGHIYPKRSLSCLPRGTDAGISPTLPSIATEATCCFWALWHSSTQILSSWRNNKILGREPFIGGLINLEPIVYIWMDFREYLAPSPQLYT